MMRRSGVQSAFQFIPKVFSRVEVRVLCRTLKFFQCKLNMELAYSHTFHKAIRGGVGLPIAVQCVALPWQEEMCLRLMREVEKLWAKKKSSNTHH